MNKQKNLYKTLVSLLFFYSLGLNALTPLWAHFTEHIGGDIRSSGYALSSFFFSFGIASLFTSKIEAKYPHYKMYISAAYLILCLTSLSYFIIDKTYELYVIQCVIGIACSLLGPAFDTIFGNNLKPGKEAKGWGLYISVTCLAIGSSTLIGAQLMHYLSYEAVFTFMLFMNVSGLIGSLFLPKELNKRVLPPCSKSKG